MQMQMQLHAAAMGCSSCTCHCGLLLVTLVHRTTSFNDLEAWHCSMAMSLRRSGDLPIGFRCPLLQTPGVCFQHVQTAP